MFMPTFSSPRAVSLQILSSIRVTLRPSAGERMIRCVRIFPGWRRITLELLHFCETWQDCLSHEDLRIRCLRVPLGPRHWALNDADLPTFLEVRQASSNGQWDVSGAGYFTAPECGALALFQGIHEPQRLGDMPSLLSNTTGNHEATSFGGLRSSKCGREGATTAPWSFCNA